VLLLGLLVHQAYWFIRLAGSFHITSPGLLLGLLVDRAGTLAASHPPRLHERVVVHDGSSVETGGMS
jgi:hypothetical protein